MELISLKYAIFVIVLLVLYYCFPKKYRWYVLLAGSMAYYVIICKWYVLFIIFTICTTYGSTIWIDKLLKEQNAIVKSHKEDWDRQTRKEYKEKGRKKRVAVMLLRCFAISAFWHSLNIYHMRASLDFCFHLAYPSTPSSPWAM